MNSSSIASRPQYELKDRFGTKIVFRDRSVSWTLGERTSENFPSTRASSTMPRRSRPSGPRAALKYRAYGASRPRWQTAIVRKPSSAAPSHTSKAEWDAIVPTETASSSYASRTFRTRWRSITRSPPGCVPMRGHPLIISRRGRHLNPVAGNRAPDGGPSREVVGLGVRRPVDSARVAARPPGVPEAAPRAPGRRAPAGPGPRHNPSPRLPPHGRGPARLPEDRGRGGRRGLGLRPAHARRGEVVPRPPPAPPRTGPRPAGHRPVPGGGRGRAQGPRARLRAGLPRRALRRGDDRRRRRRGLRGLAPARDPRPATDAAGLGDRRGLPPRHRPGGDPRAPPRGGAPSPPPHDGALPAELRVLHPRRVDRRPLHGRALEPVWEDRGPRREPPHGFPDGHVRRAGAAPPRDGAGPPRPGGRFRGHARRDHAGHGAGRPRTRRAGGRVLPVPRVPGRPRGAPRDGAGRRGPGHGVPHGRGRDPVQRRRGGRGEGNRSEPAPGPRLLPRAGEPAPRWLRGRPGHGARAPREREEILRGGCRGRRRARGAVVPGAVRRAVPAGLPHRPPHPGRHGGDRHGVVEPRTAVRGRPRGPLEGDLGHGRAGPRGVPRLARVSGGRVPLLHVPRPPEAGGGARAVRRGEEGRHPGDSGPRRAPEPPPRHRNGARGVPAGGARRRCVAADARPEEDDGPEGDHEPREAVPGGRVMEELSARTRAANLEAMERTTLDVLVIGGGIVGAWIALTAALRGHRTGLVEKGDFASGTSGKTSRLIHGGLRYLQQFRIGIVRQAARERDVLLRIAPRLVKPLTFLIPVYRPRGPKGGQLRFGLWLYDALSREKVLPGRRWVSRDEALQVEPRLDPNGLVRAALYSDAYAHDARLVMEVVKAAAKAGALVANYARVSQLLREPTAGTVPALDPSRGLPRSTLLVREWTALRGARVEDLETGRTIDVRASAVVNASGAWSEGFQSTAERVRLRPTKGIHLFVPRERIGHERAVVLTTKDRRTVFVLPWGPLSLIGTTDTDYRGDKDRVEADRADVDYLLE